MQIKVWDYIKEYESEKDHILRSIENVLQSGQLILGEQVKKFENEFSSFCGVDFGVGVNSGTDALLLSLFSLGIGPGDEVITVSNTAVPTVAAIVATGAIPKFVDIDPSSFLMDTSKIEFAITKSTKCILPVHLYGQCVDMNAISQIASKNDLFVVEDCAQAHGAEYFGQLAGSMSDVAAFSFYPTKILGTFGDAGLAITQNMEYYQKLRRLRFYGMEKEYFSIENGYNSRLDELHASILLYKLINLKSYIDRRRYLAKRYDSYLSETNLVLPKEVKGNRHSYYLYVCRHPKRNDIIAEMKKFGIFLNVSYKWPIHTMPPYKNFGLSSGDLPETEIAAREIFSLPIYPSLTDEEQDIVVTNLLQVLQIV